MDRHLDASVDMRRRRWWWVHCCDIIDDAFEAAADDNFDRCDANAAHDPMLFGGEEMGGDMRVMEDLML